MRWLRDIFHGRPSWSLLPRAKILPVSSSTRRIVFAARPSSPGGLVGETFSLSRCRCDSWRCDSYGSGQVVPAARDARRRRLEQHFDRRIRRLLARAAEALAEVLHWHRVGHERAGLDAAARGEIEGGVSASTVTALMAANYLY